MANRHQKRASKHRERAMQRALTPREQRALFSGMRQVYIWRYTTEVNALARTEAGQPAKCDEHGYSLLAPATPAKIDAAYALAKSTPLHWQVLQIGYCRDAQGEPFRLWSWLKTNQPIVAAGSGILPLLHRSYVDCMADLQEAEFCEARGVIMAPWEAAHPIRPELLAAKLKTRLHLTDHEIRELTSWGAPTVASVEASEGLDLQLAQALRQNDVGMA